jgi:transposase
MCCVRFTISAAYRKVVENHLQTAQHLGRLRQGKHLLALLAVLDGQSFAQGAVGLRVHEQTGAPWCQAFCCSGLQDTPRPKPPGRPPKLTPPPKAALATVIEAGPGKAGCRGACWRSPMIHQLVYEPFGGYDNVVYLAQLRKTLGCS